MTNEEKAKSYCSRKFRAEGGFATRDTIEKSMIYMAKWKEQQMIENGIKFIASVIPCTDGFIEDFKKALKGDENVQQQI